MLLQTVLQWVSLHISLCAHVGRVKAGMVWACCLRVNILIIRFSLKCPLCKLKDNWILKNIEKKGITIPQPSTTTKSLWKVFEVELLDWRAYTFLFLNGEKNFLILFSISCVIASPAFLFMCWFLRFSFNVCYLFETFISLFIEFWENFQGIMVQCLLSAVHSSYDCWIPKRDSHFLRVWVVCF